MSRTRLSVDSSGGHCHEYAAVSVYSCVGAPPSSPRDVRETGSTWEEERIILAFAGQGHVPVTLLNSLLVYAGSKQETDFLIFLCGNLTPSLLIV